MKVLPSNLIISIDPHQRLVGLNENYQISISTPARNDIPQQPPQKPQSVIVSTDESSSGKNTIVLRRDFHPDITQERTPYISSYSAKRSYLTNLEDPVPLLDYNSYGRRSYRGSSFGGNSEPSGVLVRQSYENTINLRASTQGNMVDLYS